MELVPPPSGPKSRKPTRYGRCSASGLSRDASGQCAKQRALQMLGMTHTYPSGACVLMPGSKK